MTNYSIGGRLRGIRMSEAVSINYLSRKLGMSRDELISIERGEIAVGEWIVDAYRDAIGLVVNR